MVDCFDWSTLLLFIQERQVADVQVNWKLLEITCLIRYKVLVRMLIMQLFQGQKWPIQEA